MVGPVVAGSGHEVWSASTPPASRWGFPEHPPSVELLVSAVQVLIPRDGEQHFHVIRNEDRNQVGFGCFLDGFLVLGLKRWNQKGWKSETARVKKDEIQVVGPPALSRTPGSAVLSASSRTGWACWYMLIHVDTCWMCLNFKNFSDKCSKSCSLSEYRKSVSFHLRDKLRSPHHSFFV